MNRLYLIERYYIKIQNRVAAYKKPEDQITKIGKGLGKFHLIIIPHVKGELLVEEQHTSSLLNPVLLYVLFREPRLLYEFRLTF